ncbi:MAG: NAD(P)-dependent oxidoreductase [Acidimicrobiales bacterium]
MSSRSTSGVTIAFLGVGQMGLPMASRLISAGFSVRAWNRSPERLSELVALGGTGAQTPAQAVSGATVVITMLSDGPTTDAVAHGAEGALATLSTGAIWLQMGTIGVEWTERLGRSVTAAGALYVDAPVSGSVGPATAGNLVILASGPDEAQGVATPIFAAMGSHTFWLGAAGAGSRTKLVLNNWLVDLVEMVAETLKFSEALGLDPRKVIEMLADAPIGSPYAVAKARSMLDGDFTANFALKYALKDALLTLETARGVNEDLPLTESLIGTWQRAVADGAGDLDLSVVYRYAGRRGG